MKIDRNPSLFPVIKKKGASDFVCGSCHQRFLYVGINSGINRCPNCGAQWRVGDKGRPNCQPMKEDIMNLRLHCEDCSWQGEQGDCKKRYKEVPGTEGDVDLYLQCPKCDSENLIELAGGRALLVPTPA